MQKYCYQNLALLHVVDISLRLLIYSGRHAPEGRDAGYRYLLRARIHITPAELSGEAFLIYLNQSC